MLAIGVDRIVEQVVNPKVYRTFFPQIESVVFKLLGKDPPPSFSINVSSSISKEEKKPPASLEGTLKNLPFARQVRTDKTTGVQSHIQVKIQTETVTTPEAMEEKPVSENDTKQEKKEMENPSDDDLIKNTVETQTDTSAFVVKVTESSSPTKEEVASIKENPEDEKLTIENKNLQSEPVTELVTKKTTIVKKEKGMEVGDITLDTGTEKVKAEKTDCNHHKKPSADYQKSKIDIQKKSEHHKSDKIKPNPDEKLKSCNDTKIKSSSSDKKVRVENKGKSGETSGKARHEHKHSSPDKSSRDRSLVKGVEKSSKPHEGSPRNSEKQRSFSNDKHKYRHKHSDNSKPSSDSHLKSKITDNKNKDAEDKIPKSPPSSSVRPKHSSSHHSSSDKSSLEKEKAKIHEKHKTSEGSKSDKHKNEKSKGSTNKSDNTKTDSKHSSDKKTKSDKIEENKHKPDSTRPNASSSFNKPQDVKTKEKHKESESHKHREQKDKSVKDCHNKERTSDSNRHTEKSKSSESRHTEKPKKSTDDLETRHTERQRKNTDDSDTRHTEKQRKSMDDSETRHTEKQRKSMVDSETRHTEKQRKNTDDLESRHTEKLKKSTDDLGTRHAEKQKRSADDSDTRHSDKQKRITDDSEPRHTEKQKKSADESESRNAEKHKRSTDNSETRHAEKQKKSTDDNSKVKYFSEKNSEDRVRSEEKSKDIQKSEGKIKSLEEKPKEGNISNKTEGDVLKRNHNDSNGKSRSDSADKNSSKHRSTDSSERSKSCDKDKSRDKKSKRSKSPSVDKEKAKEKETVEPKKDDDQNVETQIIASKEILEINSPQRKKENSESENQNNNDSPEKISEHRKRRKSESDDNLNKKKVMKTDEEVDDLEKVVDIKEEEKSECHEENSTPQKEQIQKSAEETTVSPGHWSDVTVSSVHTSDLSDFDDHISLTESDGENDKSSSSAMEKTPKKRKRESPQKTERRNRMGRKNLQKVYEDEKWTGENRNLPNENKKDNITVEKGDTSIPEKPTPIDVEPRRELRRQRKVNPRYMSDEFSSIFSKGKDKLHYADFEDYHLDEEPEKPKQSNRLHDDCKEEITRQSRGRKSAGSSISECSSSHELDLPYSPRSTTSETEGSHMHLRKAKDRDSGGRSHSPKSDASFDSVQHQAPNTPDSALNIEHKRRSSSSQHYESSDLYKPRPTIRGGRRNRSSDHQRYDDSDLYKPRPVITASSRRSRAASPSPVDNTNTRSSTHPRKSLQLSNTENANSINDQSKTSEEKGEENKIKDSLSLSSEIASDLDATPHNEESDSSDSEDLCEDKNASQKKGVEKETSLKESRTNERHSRQTDPRKAKTSAKGEKSPQSLRGKRRNSSENSHPTKGKRQKEGLQTTSGRKRKNT